MDGSFQPAPFSHALYHIVSVPRSGDTRFAPLAEIVAELPPEMRARWERAWMLSDRRSVNAKPLIYSHPATGLDTLCFHLGMTAAFLLDPGTPRERVSSAGETAALLREVEERFVRASRHLVYEHKVCFLFKWGRYACLGARAGYPQELLQKPAFLQA